MTYESELSIAQAQHVESLVVPDLDLEARSALSGLMVGYIRLRGILERRREQEELLGKKWAEVTRDVTYAVRELKLDVEIVKEQLLPDPVLDRTAGALDQRVWPRVRVLLGDEQVRLPFFLGWMKKWGVNEDPRVQVMEERSQELIAQESALRIQPPGNIKTLIETNKKKAEIVERELENIREDIFQITDMWAVGSLTAADLYVEVVPSRALIIVDKLVDNIYLTNECLNKFPQFIEHFVNLAENLRQQIQVSNMFGKFLESGSVPELDDVLNLPPRTIVQWKAYLAFDILSDWAGKGLIVAPSVPQILSRI